MLQTSYSKLYLDISVFSQQPPMHLSAPSPIHPVQGGSLSQSPVGQPGTSTVSSVPCIVLKSYSFQWYRVMSDKTN